MAKVEKLTNGTTGGPVFVYVQDGRIIRVTPMELDSTDAASWSIKARGRTFAPPRRTTLSPFSLSYRSMVYSPRRLLYPLKRVDFDPDGKRNPLKRGESKYERISWNVAAEIVTKEMKRIKRDYGPGAIMSTPGSHHLWGNVGYRHSTYFRFMNLVGFCYADHNPDSWEGWHWGAMHNWGFSWRLGIPEQYDLLEDALKNTEMIVYWSSDPETTSGIYSAFEHTSRRFWLKELGVKMVFIDPYYNHTAGLYSDKWFSPRLGTDVALAVAIAFVWITENLYDKDYVQNRTTGFDKWKDYVLGKTDGVPKTPEWAERESNIPATDRHRAGKRLKAVRRVRDVGFDQAAEGEDRLVVERDRVEPIEAQLAGVEAIPDRVGGESRLVLIARKPLFLRRRDDASVLDQRRRAVVIERRDAEHAHQKIA